MWHGLPMVIIPQDGGDQLITAQRCAEVGLGIMVEETPPTAEAVRSAVKTVLEQPDYRFGAQQFQQEIKALPPLSEAVKRLEILARIQAPQINLVVLHPTPQPSNLPESLPILKIKPH